MPQMIKGKLTSGLDLNKDAKKPALQRAVKERNRKETMRRLKG